MKLIATIATALLAATASPAALAAFPDKPVHIIVPFPPGAGGDASVRVVGKKLADLWGQPVIVDNRPGPPGVQAAAMSAPDGYTLLLGTASLLATGPLMNRSLTYKPERDFVPVGQIMSQNPVLAISNASGVNSFKELLEKARAQPGKLTYSSAGLGSTNHLMMELLQSVTQTKMIHIPYKGGGQQVQDTIAGHVDMSMFSLPSVLPHVKAGKLKPLAIVGPKRDRALPEVPTLAELGIKGVEYSIWFGLYAPAKTSRPIAKRLGDDLQRALTDPEVASQITMIGGDPAPLPAHDFAKYVASETAMWAKLIKQYKLTAE